MTGPYDDIINLPRPVSSTRPRMSALNRAAQFSPFAALTGYDAAIRETARLTDKRLELDEGAIAALDMKLQMLADNMDQRPQVAVTYFRPDERKEGGAYVTVSGRMKKIDDCERVVVLSGGERIPIGEVLELEGELFGNLL